MISPDPDSQFTQVTLSVTDQAQMVEDLAIVSSLTLGWANDNGAQLFELIDKLKQAYKKQRAGPLRDQIKEAAEHLNRLSKRATSSSGAVVRTLPLP